MDSEDGYIILTPLGVEYTAKWYLESFYSEKFVEQVEGNKEYSLLNLEGSENKLQVENFTTEEILLKLKGYRSKIIINKSAGKDAVFDLLAYDLKRKLELATPQLFNSILDWENSVRIKAGKIGLNLVPRVEIFVKTFTFMKLGYNTKYRELADTFSMPLNLYIEFDKRYDPADIKH